MILALRGSEMSNFIYANGDFESNIKYLARLKKGRKEFGLDKDYFSKETGQSEKKKEKQKAKTFR